jgi:hypothetical protein
VAVPAAPGRGRTIDDDVYLDAYNAYLARLSDRGDPGSSARPGG